MIVILRIFLYLICIISICWSILVFAGPPIIKRLITGYSNGALIPVGVTVSPKLDVGISRLDFIFHNEITEQSIEGFSRATKIAWSVFGEKPFLDITLGPSVLKNYATAKRVNIFTPSVREIDWQNINVVADIDIVALNSFAKTNSLRVAGSLNLKTAKLSNVNIDAEKFSAGDGGLTYYAQVVKGRLSELNINTPINEQLFSSNFKMEDVMIPEVDLTVPNVIFEVVLTKGARNLKIDLQGVRLSEVGGSVETIKVDGNFTQFNILQDLQIDFGDGVFYNKSPKFSDISVKIKPLGDQQYQANIEGNMEKFELSDSDNFIGVMPGGNFIIDLELDRVVSKVTSVSNIKFNTFSAANIVGNVELGFGSEFLRNLGCVFSDCVLSDFNFLYKINFDDEWILGGSNCPKSLCSLSEMDHLIRTSNTVKIFSILNQEKILNPLSSLYFFGALSSGRKINDGHELKF